MCIDFDGFDLSEKKKGIDFPNAKMSINFFVFLFLFQDLASKPQTINKKKIVVTAIVGCLVVGLIILGIVLLSGQTNLKNGSSLAQTQRRKRGLALEEVLDGSFTPARFNGTFISG